jgi:hypothetical protein
MHQRRTRQPSVYAVGKRQLSRKERSDRALMR